jgi:transposase-like protein
MPLLSRPVPRHRLSTTAESDKRPACCPYCEARTLVRKGTRRKKLERVQLWQCRHCDRVFTPAPAVLRGTTYPPRLIVEALTLYHLGHSLADTAQRLHARFGYRVSTSTVGRWLQQHRPSTAYARLRQQGRRLFPPRRTLFAVKLHHRQVYHYLYHRAKLALLRTDRKHRRFAALADFLQDVPERCPHQLFQDGARASQLDDHFLDLARLMVTRKDNLATRMAALVLPTLGDNRARHAALQRFMLANDSATIAVEVPIWLDADDLAALDRRHRLRFSRHASHRSITGHIDFLQVRNGAVHILDYKPDARTNKPIAQLTLYALALSQLAGIRLFDIKCAWFNEHEYCEFFPRKILARR